MPDPSGMSPHSGHRERLRTQYAQSGSESFPDHQILELLLTYALPRRDTNVLSHALLARFGSLTGVLSATIAELEQLDGVGHSVAVFLTLQGELARRLWLAKLTNAKGRVKLSTPLASAQYAFGMLNDRPYETVRIVCLNARCEIVHSETLQTGSLTEAQIYPRGIAEIALLRHAHSVVLMHNHPSGNPAPSSADTEVTEAVRAALTGIGVRFDDHLIVGGAYVYSYAAGIVLDLSASEPRPCTLDELLSGKLVSPPALRKVMEPYADMPL